MKKIAILTVLLLVLITATTCFASSDNVKVYLDDKLLEFDVQPMIVDGRTMVPMRKIFEELGADVQWDGETKTITGTKDDTTIVMQLDNKEMTVDDEVVTLDVPPFATDGRTLVPVRAIAESLDTWVVWDSNAKTVSVATAAHKVHGIPKEYLDLFDHYPIPDFRDYDGGSINNPDPSDMLYGEHQKYYSMRYKPNYTEPARAIRLSSYDTTGGDAAKEYVRKSIDEDVAECDADKTWKVYFMRIANLGLYSGKETEGLNLNEFFVPERIVNEFGEQYKIYDYYLTDITVWTENTVRGRLYTDEKPIILEDGWNQYVGLCILTDKDAANPLFEIVSNGGDGIIYMHMNSSKTQRKLTTRVNKDKEEVTYNLGLIEDVKKYIVDMKIKQLEMKYEYAKKDYTQYLDYAKKQSTQSVTYRDETTEKKHKDKMESIQAQIKEIKEKFQ